MKTRELHRCHGWLTEEVLQEDAVVDVYAGASLYQTIRCTTWERAREWVDILQARGYRTSIRWEEAR